VTFGHSGAERQNRPTFSCPTPLYFKVLTELLLMMQAEKGLMKRLVLTCSLQHTNHLNPDSLVVKANRSGTRARVVFDYERNNRPDDEPSDQLLLPYTVDPYCLTAQLQGDNSLVIEAPILH